MAAKILACISGKGATVARWQRGALAGLRRFPDSEKGWSEFEDYLSRAPRSTISIMVDSIDEDYRTETLPHASGSDRAQLVTRKLRQLFRATPFTAASLQDRSKGKRRQDQYLFAAVTRPDLLAPWLRVVNTLRIPISGIYLLPVVTLDASGRLNIKRPNLLIVSKNESGLRQTFCKHDKMRISRLTPSQEDSSESTGFYAEEINSTRMYLDALTVTHVDDIVTVLVLDHDGSLAGLEPAITQDRSNIECVRLGPAELESGLGAKATDMAQFADALQLHLLATARPALNLVPPTMKTRLQIHVLRKIVYAASAAVLGFGVLWSLVNTLLMVKTDREIAQLEQQTRSYQTQYQAVTQRFPEAPATSDVLRNSVEAAKRINQMRQTPRVLMFVLGKALNQSPNIGLENIEWVHGDPDVVQTGPQPLDASEHLVNGIGQFGIIGAEVLSYAGDHQAALRDIRLFTRQLAADPRVAQVEVIRLPLDLDPNAGLNGSTASQQTSQSAPFAIALVLHQDGGTR
ncbi:MAG: hypothetical protein AMJ66_01640 [Betaproteobacteria bacterium SG8_40]|nr:MAG: hypothetical protein AMJ66_01640 [Betaproteobacteria bacterium SG8_40]